MPPSETNLKPPCPPPGGWEFIVQIPQMIIDTTCEVFSTMIGVQPLASSPVAQRIRSFRESVSGMIGLTGDFRGMVAVHCPSGIARFITAEMLGMEVTEVDTDVRDAIGEISNMVAGGLKIALGAEGHHVEVSVPTTVAGASYELNCLSQAECVIIPFSIPAGEFLVEFKHLASK